MTGSSFSGPSPLLFVKDVNWTRLISESTLLWELPCVDMAYWTLHDDHTMLQRVPKQHAEVLLDLETQFPTRRAPVVAEICDPLKVWRVRGGIWITHVAFVILGYLSRRPPSCRKHRLYLYQKSRNRELTINIRPCCTRWVDGVYNGRTESRNTVNGDSHLSTPYLSYMFTLKH